jgi:hypothetical protein
MTITFSRTAGWVFLILGVSGLFTDQMLGLIRFDPLLTFIHLVLGILGMAAVANRKTAVYALWSGFLLIPFGIVGFLSPTLFALHLEVLENLLHLIFGGWGLYAGVYKKK